MNDTRKTGVAGLINNGAEGLLGGFADMYAGMQPAKYAAMKSLLRAQGIRQTFKNSAQAFKEARNKFNA
jgi:hypothetical protein